MPRDMKIADGGIKWTFTGTVTFDELMKAHDEMWKLPNFDELRFQIVNMLGVTDYDLNADYAKAIGFMDQTSVRHGRDVRIALVGTGKDFESLTATYLEAATAPNLEIRQFGDLDQARAWAKAAEG